MPARRNIATSLRRRADPRPMDQFDRLPPDVRAWLARAALPWSPRSVQKLWRRALRECGGDPARALARMDLAEARMLAKDCPKIWGRAHPLISAC
ncbi:DUF6525 family protein [Ketogulonicigenium vulgare]|uniref:Uncharacterized protein n=1 Tax=Ketogulonicigenium vulgare (strain WSH-001) TaxID=759362 RepID=F9Y744_KETVW|nr:DUF6525 family protein [Ketogulonicigenium vulgare]ADO41238.1 conserved hypothetical protein [Ketogulonicigenium vulgare Y25]AEM42234.1 hypothetical protein KVU_2396 [Ketogulonicigenium vulgare WSH-001]ALJ79854.1 hypothetical protein KVH_00795 [Ketogulonicigenium vulgare]ANW34823.1 hypothetical protein KvSKV_00805 [Ketogulonicigenium vulgare]AOZ53067.1 hypothetical protein KVC_0040 [Ketogulonicigenium vulgare]